MVDLQLFVAELFKGRPAIQQVILRNGYDFNTLL